MTKYLEFINDYCNSLALEPTQEEMEEMKQWLINCVDWTENELIMMITDVLRCE